MVSDEIKSAVRAQGYYVRRTSELKKGGEVKKILPYPI